MGFFSWLFCSILVVALVLLLFPFSVLIEFEAGERGARALFFFFKKKVYEYEKKWGMGGDDKCVDRESRPSSLGHDRDQHLGQERSDCPKTRDESEAELDERRESRPTESGMTENVEPRHPEPRSGDGASAVPVESRVAKEPERQDSRPEKAEEKAEKRDAPLTKNENSDVILSEAKDPVQSNAGSENAPATKSEVEEKDERQETPTTEAVAKKPEEPPKIEKMNAPAGESSDASHETPAEDSKPKKEKRKLSDREFWTIILTPDLDARAFRYALKILSAVLSLFRVRFIGCFVEGIQSDYMSMGYGAALNGFLKSFPYVGAWDFRMDWCHEKELRAAGSIRMSVNLLRIFCFVLETLVLVGILAWIFWRRRAHVIKTNELPELGFIRRKILEFILED